MAKTVADQCARNPRLQPASSDICAVGDSLTGPDRFDRRQCKEWVACAARGGLCFRSLLPKHLTGELCGSAPELRPAAISISSMAF